MARDARYYLDEAEHHYAAAEKEKAWEQRSYLLQRAHTAAWIAVAANAVEMADLTRGLVARP